MSEFRIIIQIEQLDDDGQMLSTYGPDEPIILWESDDADAVIHTMRAMAWTLREEFEIAA